MVCVEPDDATQPDDARTEEVKADLVKNGGFTVLYAQNQRRREPVQAALPDWLAKPSFFDASLSADLTQIADVSWIPDDVRDRMSSPPLNLKVLFPVQAVLAPAFLSEYSADRATWRRPRDLCLAAATGSGKTLAYGIPLLLLLRGRQRVALRALIVLPVRELALQVHSVLRNLFGKDLHVGIAVAGRCSMAAESRALLDWDEKEEQWHWRVDVLVCTPGRLTDHLMNTSGFCLRRLHILVVDEADRVMQENKHAWFSVLRQRLQRPPPSSTLAASMLWNDSPLESSLPLHQLLISATLTHEPAPLMKFALHHPRLFLASASHSSSSHSALTLEKASSNVSFAAPEGLKEWFLEATPESKPNILAHFLCQRRLATQRVLCFVNSRDSATRLCLFLQHFRLHMIDDEANSHTSGQQRAQIAARARFRSTYKEMLTNLAIFEINGSMPVDKQHRILARFNRATSASLLVCSDAVARGIDVPLVDCVINYEAPLKPKTYVHRVGRASRAGRPGQAYTFLEKRRVRHFRMELKSAGRSGLCELRLQPRHWKIWLEPCRAALRGLRDSSAPDVLKGKKRGHDHDTSIESKKRPKINASSGDLCGATVPSDC